MFEFLLFIYATEGNIKDVWETNRPGCCIISVYVQQQHPLIASHQVLCMDEHPIWAAVLYNVHHIGSNEENQSLLVLDELPT